MKNLIIFTFEATTPNMVQNLTTVGKHGQHVAPYNVAMCCIEMLQSFGWGFTLLYKQLKTDRKSFIFAVCHNCLAFNLSNVFSTFSSLDYIVKKSLLFILECFLVLLYIYELNKIE